MIDTKIPIYGIIIMLALISNIIVIFKIYKKYKFKNYEMLGALIYENIGIIVGAKLLSFFSNYSKFEEFDILKIGLSSYGAVIGAILCLIIFSFQFRKRIKDMMCLFMPSIPLMYAIGKVGCFLVGCCYGIEYNNFGSVIYKYSSVAPNGINLFPIQIIESAVFSVIFICIINKVLKNKFDLKILGITFVLCSVSKFILDFFRNSNTDIVFSSNQIISIVFWTIGIIIIIYNNKCTKREQRVKCEKCNKDLETEMKYCPYCSYEFEN